MSEPAPRVTSSGRSDGPEGQGGEDRGEPQDGIIGRIFQLSLLLGRKLLTEEVLPLHTANGARLLASLGPQEREHLAGALRGLLDSLATRR